MSLNPYDVLGLNKGCSKQEIRSKYKELAKTHHPDKLHGLSSEEIKQKEEYFKHVTVAYHLLMEKEPETSEPDSWKDMWERMEEVLSKQNIWGKFVNVATKYITRKKHTVRVPVTLEDIYRKKTKKVQFFLQSVIEPVKVTIKCEEFPESQFEYEAHDGSYHIVRVVFVQKEHDTYWMEEDGSLVTDIFIDFASYLKGTIVSIPYLDDTFIDVSIDSCMDIHDSIVVEGKGMTSSSDLHINVHIDGIERNVFDHLSLPVQSQLFDILQKMG